MLAVWVSVILLCCCVLGSVYCCVVMSTRWRVLRVGSERLKEANGVS
jgi:hypothetical protein